MGKMFQDFGGHASTAGAVPQTAITRDFGFMMFFDLFEVPENRNESENRILATVVNGIKFSM